MITDGISSRYEVNSRVAKDKLLLMLYELQCTKASMLTLFTSISISVCRLYNISHEFITYRCKYSYVCALVQKILRALSLSRQTVQQVRRRPFFFALSGVQEKKSKQKRGEREIRQLPRPLSRESVYTSMCVNTRREGERKEKSK